MITSSFQKVEHTSKEDMPGVPGDKMAINFGAQILSFVQLHTPSFCTHVMPIPLFFSSCAHTGALEERDIPRFEI